MTLTDESDIPALTNLASTEKFNPSRPGVSTKLYFKSGEESRSLGLIAYQGKNKGGMPG
jgi:hypothetical protein